MPEVKSCIRELLHFADIVLFYSTSESFSQTFVQVNPLDLFCFLLFLRISALNSFFLAAEFNILVKCRAVVFLGRICSQKQHLKPVLNLANVCSLNIHQTDRQAMIRFLTFSLLNMVWTIRRTLLHSQLACNEMQALARTCSRHAADSIIKNVG